MTPEDGCRTLLTGILAAEEGVPLFQVPPILQCVATAVTAAQAALGIKAAS